VNRVPVVALLVAVAAGALHAQDQWAHVGGDAGAAKYSTLDQINTANVQTLERAWTFHTGDKSGFFESTPLVVNGVLYVSAQNGVFALNPEAGTPIWKFEADGTTRRGLAYWPGDAKTSPRIVISSDSRLIALDAKSGKLVPEFGSGGFTDMGITPPGRARRGRRSAAPTRGAT
jgi:quinoprotein glucose dehydrogenase